jgi:hypothetical protein
MPSSVEKRVDIERAGSAKDVAKAMNRLAGGMEDIVPRMKKLSEKYPELTDRTGPPEELKESEKKVEEVSMKMVGTMMKIMPYMQDPEVQKAQKRLQDAMMGVQ